MSGTPRKERELFGTLLASTPPGTRSWRSLLIAIALHVVLIIAAIVTFKPFQPRASEDETLPISMIVVEEDDAVASIPNPFVRATPPPVGQPAAPRREEEQLTLPRGPLAPIVIDPNAVASPSTTVEPSGRTGTGGLSSRLLPAFVDPRVTSMTAFPPAGQTGVDAVRARISDRLSVYNDSMIAALEAERRATDWTVKDKNGGRWGADPSGIYLGKVKLPQVTFAPPAGRRDEINARVRDFNEIEQQAALEETRSSFKERVKSIRERKDRERAAKKQKPATTTEEKPITESR